MNRNVGRSTSTSLPASLQIDVDGHLHDLVKGICLAQFTKTVLYWPGVIYCCKINDVSTVVSKFIYSMHAVATWSLFLRAVVHMGRRNVLLREREHHA